LYKGNNLEEKLINGVKSGNLITCYDYLTFLIQKNGNAFCKDKELIKKSISLRYTVLNIIKNVDTSSFTEKEKKIINQIIKETLLFESHVKFDSYCQFLEYNRESKKQFYYPRRQVLQKISENMNKLIDGDLELLSISMPPGTGKSTLGIFLLTWMMGKNPDSPNLASAHSGALTRSFYDGVIQIISDSEYLWHEVFPDCKNIITNAKEEKIDINIPHRFSSLTCRAINATLTGATRCEGVLYADDLCSGIEEALSRERMDSLWIKYTNDLKSRKKMSAKELHIATRWSVNDVIGRLELEYADNEKSKFIKLSALNEKGESNFNYDYELGFDKKYFLDMKRNLDDASFSALYMNEPFEREGILYNYKEIRRYYELPKEEPDSIISICDCKDTGKDYLFLPIVFVYGDDYYIEDCICNNGDLGILDAQIAYILNKYKVKACRFEANASGGRFAEKINEMIKEKGGITHITTKYTSVTHKETRIITDAPFVREHCLFKYDSKISQGSDYSRMLKFLCSWTLIGKNKYDDVVDGMSQLARFAQSLKGSIVQVFARPF
jgi:predicted phage terminase large subunit-like protein